MKHAILLLIIAIASCISVHADDNWPQFRGPTGQGISDATHLPLTWSEHENVVWKTPIHGKAWSSPVIWKDQIWLTTATPDGRELSVVCVDKASGKILIDKILFHVDKPQYCIDFNSYASPTPCVEEGRVFVSFGSPGTACLDTADGKVLWQRTDFVCNHFRGPGSSPLLWNDLLIMNFDGSDFQFIVALDKKTGQNVWKTPRSIDYQDLNADGRPAGDGDFRKAFSSPKVGTWQGQPMLISLGSHAVYCYEPLTGKERWRTEYRAGHSGSLTPVFGDDLIFTGTGHGATELWAIRPGGTGVVNDTNVVWRDKKKVPTRPSPVFFAGVLYMVNDAGIVSILNAKTGDELAHGRIDGGYSAAPMYADGRVYFFNEAGKTTVLATEGKQPPATGAQGTNDAPPQSGEDAKSEKKNSKREGTPRGGGEIHVLAENQLDDGIMGCPAVSGDAIYIRTRTNLYRIEGKPPVAPAAASQ